MKPAKAALARQGVAQDLLEVVVPRLPAEPLEDAGVVGHHRRRVARAPPGGGHLERPAEDPGEGCDHLAHREAAAVAAVQGQALAAAGQVLNGLHVGVGEVGDVDEIAHAGAIGGRVVVAEHGDLRAEAERRLAHRLDQVAGPGGRSTGAPGGIAAGDVEVAQRHKAQPVGRADVGQDLLGHELGAAVGGERAKGRVLGHRHVLGIAIDRRGRGEDEGLDARLDAGLEQGEAAGGVVAVVEERPGDRLRGHDRAREMQHHAEPLLPQQPGKRLAGAGIADHQPHALGQGRAASGREVVDHHHPPAGVHQRPDHMAADVAGPAGDQGGAAGGHHPAQSRR
jgi:hypothetical protein